eukprot:360165-Chlamydomonas_euryale.AAC.3
MTSVPGGRQSVKREGGTRILGRRTFWGVPGGPHSVKRESGTRILGRRTFWGVTTVVGGRTVDRQRRYMQCRPAVRLHAIAAQPACAAALASGQLWR